MSFVYYLIPILIVIKTWNYYRISNAKLIVENKLGDLVGELFVDYTHGLNSQNEKKDISLAMPFVNFSIKIVATLTILDRLSFWTLGYITMTQHLFRNNRVKKHSPTLNEVLSIPEKLPEDSEKNIEINKELIGLNSKVEKVTKEYASTLFWYLCMRNIGIVALVIILRWTMYFLNKIFMRDNSQTDKFIDGIKMRIISMIWDIPTN